ncbi:MAG: murein biosynthesis integral membrane protein MurJ [Chloroflexi bacterium]|nr:murein biosynthesis integral membrane protein MurJ [Chloroflexota bacterium]
MSETETKPQHSLARAAGIVMLAFILSQLTGLIAKILIAGSFSAGVELDAFYAANRPSETLVTIMAGGILVSSFIPIFVKFLVKEDRGSAWKLASATANLILVLMSLLAGLAALFAGPIVQYLLGAGFSPDKQALTVSLLRIQTISIVFFGLSGLAVGILNSHQKFLIPALAPAMYQLGQIFGVLVLAPSLGIYGLAWGVVLGSVFNLLIQIPSLLRLKGRFIPTFGLRNPAVGEVFRLMGPRMFGAAVVQLMLWVNTLLASHMAGGSVFSLTSGFSLMIMAQAAIAQSVATAVMPTFSAQYAQGKLDELRKTLTSALRGVILLSVPATAGLILLSVPLVTFLYQRGEFTAETTKLVAWALTWYAAGLVFHSVLEVLVRAYYAMHDTKTPVLVGAAAMTLSIGLSLVFAPLFQRIGWMPHGGLALAVSVSTALEVTTLFLIMRKRLNGIHGPDIAKGFGAAALGTLSMIAALVFWMRAAGSAHTALTTLGGVVIGGTVYAAALVALRIPEVGRVVQMVKRRLSR